MTSKGMKTLAAGLSLVAAACAQAGAPIDFNRNGTIEPYEDPALPRETRIADLISRMTVSEKAAQLTQYHVVTFSKKDHGWGKRQYDQHREAVRRGLGALLWFDADLKGRNEWQRIAVEQTRLGVPMIFVMDIIHGDRLIYPIALGLACSFEPEMFRREQEMVALETSAYGIDWAFAPMCDLGREPRWGRVCETSGEDPYLASLCCAAQVRGFQGPDPSLPDRVLATSKHFAGYAAVTGGRDYNDCENSDWTLWNVHFATFRAAIEAGVSTMCSAFNPVDGVPAVMNRRLLTGMLRGGLGYRGFVFSDWQTVSELIQWGCVDDEADAVARALNAGNDVDMVSGCYERWIPECIRRGTLSVKTVDEAVRRVLDVKFRAGLFERPYTDETRLAKVEPVIETKGRELSRECAEKSMVLLSNDGILPLAPGKLRRLALIGPVADDLEELNGSWCYRAKPLRQSIFTALKAALPETQVTLVKGCSVNTEPPSRIGFDGVVTACRDAKPEDKALDLEGAVKAAKEADVVVMTLAEAKQWTGENASRSKLTLTGRQQELFDAVAAVGKPIVTVVYSGRPLALPEVWEKSSAVIYAWQPGSEGPAALANLLTGAVEPYGRLSISVPHDVGQLPVFYNRSRTGRPGDGQYVDTKERGSRFPFGYGLTYTTFEYGPVEINGSTASCEVKNTGRRAGSEVAQLYIRQKACHAGWRPVCELRGFSRVKLSPGESKRVSFELTGDVLGYVDRLGCRTADPDEYTVWISANSRDLRKGATFHLGKGAGGIPPGGSCPVY